jgi:hypothetical protein
LITNTLISTQEQQKLLDDLREIRSETYKSTKMAREIINGLVRKPMVSFHVITFFKVSTRRCLTVNRLK